MTLSHRIAEIQAAVQKLEDDLGDVTDYPSRTLEDAALALTDLAVRMELARLVVLDSGADDRDAGA